MLSPYAHRRTPLLIRRNPSMARVQGGYLFSEIAARKRQFLQAHPEAQLVSLGIGDTTEPLSSCVTEALVASSSRLGTPQGYVGYGPEQGIDLLREGVARHVYGSHFAPNEIFISDGTCCDIARLQVLFGSGARIAVQDPSYPAYIDGSLLNGVQQIHLMPCLPEREFFPDVHALPPVDLIYFCSPNNPTGAVASRRQLEGLVDFARKRKSIIIFDRAYSSFINDPSLPKSIYEVEEAESVAIEIGSFSKSSGFTGVRLGWSVVPEALKYDCGRSVRSDWDRVVTTLFNGASIIAQHGGLAALVDQRSGETIKFYLENARLIRAALESRGYEVFGGTQAPYLWVRFPGQASWDVFQELLEKAHIVTVPGSGFGPSGEGVRPVQRLWQEGADPMRDRKTQTFVKYHSLGNDFVLFDWRGKNADAVMATVQDASWAPYVRQICQQHFGVGANGVLVVMPQNEFLIFNEDGSQAESCLNGLRCVADYLITNGSIQIRMGQRLCICSLSDGEIVSDVGPVEILGEERLSIARKVLSGYSISVGNPHFVIMKKTTAAWLARHGQSLERHELFPQRTNVEFVWAAEDPFSYHVLVYERGCGMTLACGSGAAAITGLFHRQGLIADGQKIALKMAGGTLSTWVEPSGHVMLSARAQKVFIGTVRFD